MKAESGKIKNNKHITDGNRSSPISSNRSSPIGSARRYRSSSPNDPRIGPKKNQKTYLNILGDKNESPDELRQPVAKKYRENKDRWADDPDEICTVCGIEFTMIVRRHHCRKCKHIVCHKCSSNFSKIPGRGDKPVRICDLCYSVKNKHTIEADSKTENLLKILRKRRNKRWWFGFYKCFSSNPDSVVIGELFIKIIKARNLPVMDALSSDPYVTGKFGIEKFKTKAITSTINPVWNKTFVLNVTNATSTLILKLWDKDVGTEDELMGEVQIPFWVLSNQELIDHTFDINLAPGVPSDPKSLHIPQLCLQLQYTVSRWGEFFSYFSPEAEPYKEEPYSTDSLYNEAMRIITFCQPLFMFFGLIGEVIMWQNPSVSGFVLISFWIMWCYPWTSPVFFQLLLIRHMCLKYLEIRWTKDKEYANVMAQFEEIRIIKNKKLMDEDNESSDDEDLVERKKKENDKKKTAYLKFMDSIVSKDWNEWLGWIQNLLKWLTDIGEFTVGLFQWSHIPTTRAILITLIFTTVYSCVRPFSDIVLVGGTYVLTMNTTIVSALQGILINFFWWLLSYRPELGESEKYIRMGCYTNKTHERRMKKITDEKARNALRKITKKIVICQKAGKKKIKESDEAG